MLRLAVPSILANITIPLVGMVDVAIMGHVADVVAVAGIAVGTMLFDLLYWNFGFLRVGTSGLTAQAYGRGGEDCAFILRKALRTAVISAAILLAIQWLFVKAVLAMMPCSREVADFASSYFFIRIWAAPATLSLMAFKGWFIGMQNTKAPMAVDIVVNVMNMAVSYFLAVGFCSWQGLGAIGVAWGTLIAQYVGLLVAVAVLWIRYRETLKWSSRDLRDISTTSPRHLSNIKIWQFNTQLIIRSLCMLTIYVGYTIIASTYGDGELAVSNILMKYFLFFSYFVDGFAYAGEAMVGKEGVSQSSANEAQGWTKTPAVRAIVRVLFYWSAAIGLLFSLIYGLGATPLLRLMTSDLSILAAARPYYIWLALMPFVSSLAFLWDGVFIGATNGPAVRNVMIISAVSFVLTYLATYAWLGIQALYLAYFAHLLARTLYLSFCWKNL